MSASGRAALTFFWPQLGRQVRVEGAVTRASDAEAAADFLARPAVARATALVGRPREPLVDDAGYVAARAAAAARIDAEPMTVPDAWALWRIAAHSVEFWQAAHDRAHLRLRYSRIDGELDPRAALAVDVSRLRSAAQRTRLEIRRAPIMVR